MLRDCVGEGLTSLKFLVLAGKYPYNLNLFSGSLALLQVQYFKRPLEKTTA